MFGSGSHYEKITAWFDGIGNLRCGTYQSYLGIPPADDVRTAYIVAREAANCLARCMGLELAPFGVQVNAIALYMLYNETFFPSSIGAEDPQFSGLLDMMVPMRRFGTDEEISALVALLSSEKSAFVLGQVIAFSGADA